MFEVFIRFNVWVILPLSDGVILPFGNKNGLIPCGFFLGKNNEIFIDNLMVLFYQWFLGWILTLWCYGETGNWFGFIPCLPYCGLLSGKVLRISLKGSRTEDEGWFWEFFCENSRFGNCTGFMVFWVKLGKFLCFVLLPLLWLTVWESLEHFIEGFWHWKPRGVLGNILRGFPILKSSPSL